MRGVEDPAGQYTKLGNDNVCTGMKDDEFATAGSTSCTAMTPLCSPACAHDRLLSGGIDTTLAVAAQLKSDPSDGDPMWGCGCGTTAGVRGGRAALPLSTVAHCSWVGDVETSGQ